MTGEGVMEEIRTLLSRGSSSGELIAVGYRPSTVYKVQRQCRRRDEKNQMQVGYEVGTVLAAPMGFQEAPGQKRENNDLMVEIDRLRDRAAEADTIRDHLYQAHEEIRRLEALSSYWEGRSSAAEAERDRTSEMTRNLELQMTDAFPVCPKCDQGRSQHWSCGHQLYCPSAHGRCTGNIIMRCQTPS